MGWKPDSSDSSTVSGSTEHLEIHLARFSDDPKDKRYLAILDDRGAKINEPRPDGLEDDTAGQIRLIQRIAQIVRVIVVVADHANISKDGALVGLDERRLDQQKDFIERCLIHQMINCTSNSKSCLRAIFLILNKRDAWHKSLDDSAKAKFREWGERQKIDLTSKLKCDVHIYCLSALDKSYPEYDNFKKHLGRCFEDSR